MKPIFLNFPLPYSFDNLFHITLEAALPALQRVVKEVGVPGMWRYNGIMVMSKGPQLAIKVNFGPLMVYFVEKNYQNCIAPSCNKKLFNS